MNKIFWAISSILIGSIISTQATASDQKVKADYMQYCASCHGENGKGNGKAADLTQLSKKNGGIFPYAKIRKYIDGRPEKGFIRAHGIEMPIWGEEFTKQEFPSGSLANAEALTKMRILNIIDSLVLIQEAGSLTDLPNDAAPDLPNISAASMINFEYQSFDISESAKDELNKLVVMLNNNDDVAIEIRAHTDSKGGHEYNTELGQQRADAVVNYLVSKGISKDRLVAKNYGQTKPLAPNNFSDGSDNPEGRAKNRRVEFIVIQSK